MAVSNDRIQELARSIPSIASARRLSKYTIVQESIHYHRVQNRRCRAAVTGILSLMEERDDLLKELNALRALVNPGAETRSARPIHGEVLELLKHENEFTDHHTATTTVSQEPSEDSSHADTDTGGSKNSPAMKVTEGPRTTDMPPVMVGNDSVFVDSLPVSFGPWSGPDTVQSLPSDLSAPNYNGDAVSINQQPSGTQQTLPISPNDFASVNGSTMSQFSGPPIEEFAPLASLNNSQFVASSGPIPVVDSYFGQPASNHVLLY